MQTDLKVYYHGNFMGNIDFDTLMTNMTNTMDSMKEYVDNAHAEIERLENVEMDLNEAIDNKDDTISDLKDDIVGLTNEVNYLKDK